MESKGCNWLNLCRRLRLGLLKYHFLPQVLLHLFKILIKICLFKTLYLMLKMLNDKTGGDSDADYAPGRSTLGLPQVDIPASGLLPQGCRLSTLTQSDGQHGHLASAVVLPADSNIDSNTQQRARVESHLVGESADATRIGAVHPQASAGSVAAAEVGVGVQTPVFSTQKIRMHADASGLTPLSARQAQWQHGAEELGRQGSSAPKITKLNSDAACWPQKIQPTVAGGATMGPCCQCQSLTQ
jgi:hypothetical protein